MNKLKYILPLIFLALWFDMEAQSIRGLEENQIIKKYCSDQGEKMKVVQKASVVLSLPFFEDFSTSTVVPDPVKWTDQYVFINNSFALDPISINVATLDAIDENGEVYALNNTPTSSDRLTSRQFDLSSYTYPGDVIRLSFFYQSGGLGETPELTDSLLLELYNPGTSKWSRIWFSISDTVTGFQQAIIEIPGSYYVNGFQFRFRNYTSMSPDDVSGGEGALSNVDCWNIDYIMMNTAPLSAHKEINDITLIDIPRNMLDFYETVPWSHLNSAQSITRNLMNFDIRNLMAHGNTLNLGRSYYTRDLSSGYVENYEEFFEQLPTDTLIRRYDPFFAPFTSNSSTKEGAIEVVSYLVTPGSQYKPNDTSRIVLNFRDAYAYDDGSAEFGFGIEGPSTNGALMAMRFRVYKPDTLRALDMMFNKTRNNFTSDLPFRLCVWKDGGTGPGDLIYMSPEDQFPDFGTGSSPFIRYAIRDQEIIVTDTVIYVGWKQLTEEFLNIGYDVNRDNTKRTFFNTSGNWANAQGSILSGTIMTRAVFGGTDVITSLPEPTVTPIDVCLYPNPVSDLLYVNSSESIKNIHIFDITSRMVIQINGEQNQVDVSSLAPGIYQVVINTIRNKPGYFKIIVCH
jgi:hypothetical protein